MKFEEYASKRTKHDSVIDHSNKQIRQCKSLEACGYAVSFVKGCMGVSRGSRGVLLSLRTMLIRHSYKLRQ